MLKTFDILVIFMIAVLTAIVIALLNCVLMVFAIPLTFTQYIYTWAFCSTCLTLSSVFGI